MTDPAPKKPRYRLFTDNPLGLGETVALDDEQSHYLSNVMRAEAGETIALFNGHDGEWIGSLATSGKRPRLVTLNRLAKPQSHEPISGPWLLFAPLKKHATDMVIEKATELGASLLWPILTRHTNTERVNVERLRLNARQAAEQCERLSIPEVRDPIRLSDLAGHWPKGRALLMLDETGRGASLPDMLAVSGPGDTAFLVGPEGGFADGELNAVLTIRGATRVTLGTRILRAETAAMAALACWQAVCGDWRKSAFRLMS